MRLIARLCLAGLALLASMALLTASHAQDIQPIINDFATAKSFKKVEAVIDRLAEAGDPAAAISLRALSDGRLKFRKSDGTVLITVEEDGVFGLQDPLTGEAVPTEGAVAKDFKKVKVKNSIRRKIAAVLSGMTLQAKDVAQRLAGAETIFATSDVTALPALKAAIEKETDEGVKEAFLDAQASAILASDLGASEKLAAVERLEARGDRASLALLSKFLATSEGELAARTKEAIEYIESFQSLWTNAQNIWYGISLGSVLLLAAIGLAITFGVMGVINMAHGEMVMLGAYTTFTVQQFLILYFPALLPFALLFALPLVP